MGYESEDEWGSNGIFSKETILIMWAIQSYSYEFMSCKLGLWLCESIISLCLYESIINQA